MISFHKNTFEWIQNLPVFFSELFIEKHENVTILFADICNFTPLTTTLSVDKLVETLNDLFGKFDDAADVSQLLAELK